nr:MAG TPA: hypothetical protein [Caudoviricetes sp.]
MGSCFLLSEDKTYIDTEFTHELCVYFFVLFSKI